MEPKSNSVIIAIANNKGPGPSPSPSPSPVHEIVPRHDEKSTDDHVGAATPTAADVAAAVNNYKKKRSGGGAMHILQVAMFMLRRRRSSGKSKSVSLKGDQALASSKGAWKRLVGSIRPLHLQSSSPMNGSVDLSVTSSERYEDVLPPPMSPARTDDLASEDGMTSRYASAVNLQELDRPEGDATNGPASGEQNVNIDAKAEEFIAQFYQQMRLQRSDSINV